MSIRLGVSPLAAACRTERLLIFATLLATGVSLAIALLAPDTWRVVGREDGLIELANAVALGALAVVALRSARRAEPGRRTPSVALAVLGLVGIGEEISWGQRLFGLAPPPFFETYNVQQETNIHNLVPPPWDVVLAGLLVLGFCLSPWCKDFAWARSLRSRGVPWPKARHSFTLATSLAAVLVVGLITRVGDLEELGELNIVLLIAAGVASDFKPAASQQVLRAGD